MQTMYEILDETEEMQFDISMNREADRVEDEESSDSESAPENEEVKGRHAYNVQDRAECRRNCMSYLKKQCSAYTQNFVLCSIKFGIYYRLCSWISYNT